MSNQNFKRGHGRLGTDRFDFQKHINGEDFRQKSSTVDLDTTLTHMGATVEDALLYLEANGGSGGGVVNLSNLAETTGILPIVRGGTGLNAVGSNGTVFISDGSAAAWQQIVNANISNSAAIGVAKLAAGSSNQVLITSGSTPTWSSIVNANISNSAAISVSKLAAGSNTQVLTTVAGVPTWAAPTGGGDGYSLNFYGTIEEINPSTGLIDVESFDSPETGTYVATVNITDTDAEVSSVNGINAIPGRRIILNFKNGGSIYNDIISADEQIAQNVTVPAGESVMIYRSVESGIYNCWGVIGAPSSDGATSAGSSGQVQAADGAGGFQAPANVFAGTNFISIGSTPSTTGFLRVPYSASPASILSIKDNIGTNRNLLQFDGGATGFGIGEYGIFDTYLSGRSNVLNASLNVASYVGGNIKQNLTSTTMSSLVPIAFGITPATSNAWLRIPYDPSFASIIDIKDSGGVNRGVLGMSGTDVIHVGSYGNNDLYLNGLSVVTNASVQDITYVNGVLKQTIAGAIQRTVPSIGVAGFPWASDGAAHIASAGTPTTYDIGTAEYCYFVNVLYHSGGGTFRYPRPTGYADTYVKWVENLGSSAKTITNNGTLGFTVSLPPNSRRLLKFNVEGVVMLDSGGGSSAGSSGQMQTSDGAGGFLAPSNVFAGTNFISIGSTPATSGSLRFPTSAGAAITVRNAANTSNLAILGIGPDTANFGGTISYTDQCAVTTVQTRSGGIIYGVVGTDNAIVLTNDFFGSLYPRLGYGSPYASEGIRSITLTSSPQTLTSTQYDAMVINITGNSANRTAVFPAPNSNDKAYLKWIRAVANGTFEILTVSTGIIGATPTLDAGKIGLFLFVQGGVNKICEFTSTLPII